VDAGPSDSRRLELSAWGDPVGITADALARVAASDWGNIDELVRKAAALALLAEIAAADPGRAAALAARAGLDPNAAQRRAVTLLEAVAAAQDPGGALPWFPNCPPSLATSLFALEDLAIARRLAPQQADAIARRLLPWVASAVLAEVGRERASSWLLVRGASALAAWPSTGEVGALVTAAQRRVVLEAAWGRRGELSREGRARLALAFTREGERERASALVAELLAAATVGDDGVLRFAPGARDWASEPDSTLTQATLLQVLVALGPEREASAGPADALAATAGWLIRDVVANGPERCAAELLRTVQGLLAWADSGSNTPPGTLRAEVLGEEGAEGVVLALPSGATDASRLVFEGTRVSPQLLEVPVWLEAPAAARVVVGARLTWESEVLPTTSSSGGAVSVDRRLLVADSAAATGWRELGADEPTEPGTEVRVELTVESALPLDFVRISDPRPGGFEPVDAVSGPRWADRRYSWHEVREGSLEVLVERLPAGRFVVLHQLRARTTGVYRAAPASIAAFYTPELAAFSAGASLVVGTAR
jgi:hypothetical protein